MITEIRGDLFSANTSLAHCVSKDFKMGAGIAYEFKKRFDNVEKLKLWSNNHNVGDVAVIQIDNNKFIFYLVTKNFYYQKPTYQTLELSLLCLKSKCIDLNIKKLSIPKIGCGLDKLNWKLVKKKIEDIFNDTNIDIDCYYL